MFKQYWPWCGESYVRRCEWLIYNFVMSIISKEAIGEKNSKDCLNIPKLENRVKIHIVLALVRTSNNDCRVSGCSLQHSA